MSDIIRKFNKLTETEFMALAGSDKFANMISNKFVTNNVDVLEWLFDNTIGQYCVVKDMGNQWIMYFESQDDIQRVLMQFNTPHNEDAPAIHTINIADEFKNT
tara:strand:- start:923 stop:1231 length:309 start_codon:yes stop_codon:yes gene_type:complete